MDGGCRRRHSRINTAPLLHHFTPARQHSPAIMADMLLNHNHLAQTFQTVNQQLQQPNVPTMTITFRAPTGLARVRRLQTKW
jgi:hypothetical protein